MLGITTRYKKWCIQELKKIVKIQKVKLSDVIRLAVYQLILDQPDITKDKIEKKEFMAYTLCEENQ